MSRLRAKCPDCRTYTAVALGPEYQCHACGRTFGAALVWHTGSEAHLQRLTTLAKQRGLELGPRLAARTEEDVYALLDLPWIAPELREDQGEMGPHTLDRSFAGTYR